MSVHEQVARMAGTSHSPRESHKTPSSWSPTNFIDPSATWGERTVIWHYATVMAGVRIGSDCSIGSGTEIGRDSIIGDRSRISAHVFLPANARIGLDVFIGPGVICTDDRYPRTLKPGETYTAEPPIIEDGASIGAGSILLPGVRIGAGARVGAGTIVTKDVPAAGFVRGEPGRLRELSVAGKGW